MTRLERYLLAGLLSLSVILLIGWAKNVQSQEKYPSKPIDLIIGLPAGGGVDVNQRVTTTYLSNKWKVPINVINKPGGKTVPATLELHKALPDGYTMFGDSIVTGPLLELSVKDLPFKVMDRTFIATVSAVPYVIYVPSSSRFKTLKDLITEAKTHPEKVSFVAGDIGIEFTLRKFCEAMGLDISKMKAVMARDGVQVVTLVAGGNVDLGASFASSSLPAIKAGTVRPLTIAYKTRYPLLPEVPTCEEMGYPPFVHVGWNGISGPPKLPSHIVDIWSVALKEMVKDPEIITRFNNVGAQPFYKDPKETMEHMRKEMEDAKRILSQ